MGDSYSPSSQHGQAMLASVPILCIHNDSQWLDRNALCLRCSGPCFWIKYSQVLRFRQLFSALICFHECNKTLCKKKDMPWCISFNIILACDSCISSVHLFKTCLSRPILCGRCQRWRVICCDCRFSTWRKELESSKSSFGPKVTKKNCKIIASKRVRTHSNFKTPFLSLRFPICRFSFFKRLLIPCLHLADHEEQLWCYQPQMDSTELARPWTLVPRIGNDQQMHMKSSEYINWFIWIHGPHDYPHQNFPYQKQEFDKALLLLEGTVVANNPL